MAWTEAESHPYFGNCYLADLGAYTGPWPPTAPAIRMRSTIDLEPGVVTELDLVVGIPHPGGDPLLAFDGSYATDLYDAYRTTTRDYLSIDQAFLDGSQVNFYEDSPGGGPGDFSVAPPGAHVFIVWYPGNDVTFGIGWTPGVTPESLVPSGYSGSTSGPTQPDLTVGAWSTDQTGDIEKLGPTSWNLLFYEQGYNLFWLVGWFVGDGDVAAQIAPQLDAIQADGLSSVRVDNAGSCWCAAWTYKGQQALNGDGSQNSRAILLQLGQASMGFDFSGIDTFTPPSYPFGLLNLHENLDYALPPTPYGGGFDAGSINYDSAITTHVGWQDFLITPFDHFEWTSANAADGWGASGQGHALTGGTFPSMGMRVSYLEGTLAELPTTEFGTAQKWQDWDEGTLLNTISLPDLSGAIAGHKMSVALPSAATDTGFTVQPTESYIDVDYEAVGANVQSSAMPLGARIFALNFKFSMQDPAFALPFFNYAMRTGNNTDIQYFQRNFEIRFFNTEVIADMELPTWRYWDLTASPPAAPGGHWGVPL